MIRGKCGDNLTWIIDNDGTLNIKGTGKMKDYHFVCKAPWHGWRISIKKIVICHGVTTIDSWAFDGYTKLTSVIISDSITSIGKLAFGGCFCLTTVTIPDSVIAIDDCAFSGCLRLTKITIPCSVKIIGEKVFDSCDSLKEIHYPAGRGFEKALSQGNNAKLIPYTNTPPAAMYKAQASVIQSNSSAPTSEPPLPNFEWTPTPVTEKLRWDIAGTTLYVGGISEIKDCSREEPPWFNSLSNIQKIVIADDVQKIAANAFSNCINLEQLIIPYSVRTIGDFAFTLCYCGEQTVNGGKNVIWSLDDGVLMIKKNPAAKSETNFATGFKTWQVVERNIRSVKIERGVIPGKNFFDWLAHVRKSVQVSL